MIHTKNWKPLSVSRGASLSLDNIHDIILDIRSDFYTKLLYIEQDCNL